jgi:hypothetical protein
MSQQTPISMAEAIRALAKQVNEIKAEYQAAGKPIPNMDMLQAVAEERAKHQQRGSEGDSSTAAPSPPAAAKQQEPPRVMTRAAAMTLAKQLGKQAPTTYREAREFAGLSPNCYLTRDAGQPVEVTLVSAGVVLLMDFKALFIERYYRYTTRTCQQMWDATSSCVNLDGKPIISDTHRAPLERLRLFLQLQSTDTVAFDAPKVLDKLRNCIYKRSHIGHDMKSFVKNPEGRDMGAEQLADEAISCSCSS